MPAPVLQFKRGIFSNLPGLRAGEPGFTTDSYELYVGINSTTQENKFFGSHRYWTRQTATTGSGVNLVEGSNNGTEYITLASPASVGAAVTYYFPAANGGASSVLTNDGSGNLSWASGSANPVFSGIATFSDTTNNTLGTENTGAVQIDGGVGIAKAAYVGTTLNVGGASTFTGAIAVDSVTDSSSTTTGSIQTDGGLGVAKAVYVGTTLNVAGNASFTSTGAVLLSKGTTAQQPAGVAGSLRFNTDTNTFEGYNGTAWAAVGGGATGGGTDQIFVQNQQTVTTNYTITTNYNAMSTGPITINSSITVTVPSGSNWVVL